MHTLYEEAEKDLRHSPEPYIRHVCCLHCNIARCQVPTRVTLGKFIRSKPGINRQIQHVLLQTAYFTHFFLNPQKSLHNSGDSLKFWSLGKTNAGHLQCLYLMNDSHMVAFWNLLPDQCDVTDWAMQMMPKWHTSILHPLRRLRFSWYMQDVGSEKILSAVQCQKDALVR